MNPLNQISLLALLLSLACTTAAQSPGSKRPKVGLVLSGGSAKGLAHIGVLQVIEEAGLPIDYIGGASMGSIIGGLYAIGYDADSLEKLAVSMDWNKLITDEISRTELSIEEKEDADRFYVTFPVRERRVQLPTGVIPGQNVENRLSLLCAHVYDTRDFNDFPIPCLCMAADIETGEEVELREGYLPQAMRASMAVPTIFSPIMLDGRLLVDGGLINNFPVSNVRDMGAEIVIGVDVGMTYNKTEEITDLFRVLEQVLILHGKEKIDENRDLCDILIDPDLGGYGLQSFGDADSLIARGYRAARKHFPEFKALADSLNEIEQVPFKKPFFEPVDSIRIRGYDISGLENVSKKLVTGKLHLEKMEKVTPRQLFESIEHAYASLYFNKISYELQPVPGDGSGRSARLLVNVREKAGGLIKVGLNYNNEYKATIALNATFRNVLLNGSKLSFTASLGENPILLASYFKNNGWKPGFGIDLLSQNFGVNIYQGGQKESIIDYTDFVTRLYTRSIINNSYSFGFGLEYEHVLLQPRVGSSILPDEEAYDLYNLYGFIDFDTYDHFFYPTRGARVHGEYKFINHAMDRPLHFLLFKFEKAISAGEKLVIKPGISAGTSTSDSTFPGYFFYMGGLNKTDRKGLLPFAGLDLTQEYDRTATVFGLDIQYNIWRQNYITLRTNLGNATWSVPDQYLHPDWFYGAGLSLGNNSIIGPVELTFMSSNLRDDILLYLHLGYWF